MTRTFKNSIFLFLFLLAFQPPQTVSADLGPKPTMEFEFKQDLPGGQVTITSGIMYECDQADCSDAQPLEELGPQRFTCDSGSCRALAYGFSPYHKLEIQFSDGITRSSNVFETGGFDSVYQVTVQADDLLVELKSATAAPIEVLQSAGNDLARIVIIILVCVCVAMSGLVVLGLIIFVVRRSAKK